MISRRTAERHVQDVYARIGVSSRAAAALFAMEHDLLSDGLVGLPMRAGGPGDPPGTATRPQEETQMEPKDVVRRFIDEYQTAGDRRAWTRSSIRTSSTTAARRASLPEPRRAPAVRRVPRGLFRLPGDDPRQLAEGDKVVTRKVFQARTTARFRASPPPAGGPDPRDRHRPGGRRPDRRALELCRPARPACPAWRDTGSLVLH